MTPIYAGTAFEVIWDVANTNLSPINCLNVDFDLISFSPGYGRYSIHPLDAASNLNDGNEFVTLNPTMAIRYLRHPRSRVRVKCSDNIFYDLSDTDLTIAGDMSHQCQFGRYRICGLFFCDRADCTETVAPACGVPVECAPPAISSRSAGRSSGAFDYLWLLMMTGIVALVKWYRRYGLQ